MRKSSPITFACASAAVLMLCLGSGCQTSSAPDVPDPAYLVGVTPLGMRLDPIVWGTITRFDIVGVDGQAPSSKSRISVPPGQHTFLVTAASGWSGAANTSRFTFSLSSGHTYLLRPTTIGGLIYVIVVDNDEGRVVYRPTVVASPDSVPVPRVMTTESVVAPPAAPAPARPEAAQYNADGSLKTKTLSEDGRISISKAYDGSGKLEYTESSYYASDGRIVRKDQRDADGKLVKVVVYFDSVAKIFDQDGTPIGTEDSAKNGK